MRFLYLTSTSMILAASAAMCAAQSHGSFAGSSATFTITQRTLVPGETLKPGEYSIHVIDQLTDRMIVRIDSASGKDRVTFLGVPHANLAEANGSGPVEWKSGPDKVAALRGFEFSPGTDVEFVYPKADAAALATINTARVVAVDPQSEGRPALKKMAPEDMQEVTLWMLSLTTVAPTDKKPAIAAQRYTGEGEAGGTTVVSSSTPTASAPQASQLAKAELPPQPAAQSQPLAAPVRHQRAVSQLPHTASMMPLVFGCGLLSLSIWVALGVRRKVLALSGR